MENEVIKELGEDLPKDKSRFISVEFYDNMCHTNFSGYWDGKMIKAALRSIERQYAATKHMMTRRAIELRAKAAIVSSTMGGSDG
jgi:hypothetical protein